MTIRDQNAVERDKTTATTRTKVPPLPPPTPSPQQKQQQTNEQTNTLKTQIQTETKDDTTKPATPVEGQTTPGHTKK